MSAPRRSEPGRSEPGRSEPGRIRWNGSLVLFDVSDGGKVVECAISKGAIEDMAGTFCRRPEDATASLRALWPRIETIVRRKLAEGPPGAGGRLHLWADDVDETGDPVPSAAAPHA